MVQFENAPDDVIRAAYEYVTEGKEPEVVYIEKEGNTVTIRWHDFSNIEPGATEIGSGGDIESRMATANEKQIKRVAGEKGLADE